MDLEQYLAAWNGAAPERLALIADANNQDGTDVVCLDQGTLAALVILAKNAASMFTWGDEGPRVADQAVDRALCLLTGEVENAVVETLLRIEQFHREYPEAKK